MHAGSSYRLTATFPAVDDEDPALLTGPDRIHICTVVAASGALQDVVPIGGGVR